MWQFLDCWSNQFKPPPPPPHPHTHTNSYLSPSPAALHVLTHFPCRSSTTSHPPHIGHQPPHTVHSYLPSSPLIAHLIINLSPILFSVFLVLSLFLLPCGIRRNDFLDIYSHFSECTASRVCSIEWNVLWFTVAYYICLFAPHIHLQHARTVIHTIVWVHKHVATSFPCLCCILNAGLLWSAGILSCIHYPWLTACTPLIRLVKI